MFRRVVVAMLLVALSSSAAVAWQPQTVQGLRLNVPVGWKVKVLNPKLLFVSDPLHPPGQDAGMLFGWDSKQSALTTSQITDQVMRQIVTGNDRAELIGEERSGGVLSRLYLVTVDGQTWYTSVASFAGDSKKGAWYAAFFNTEKRFGELGASLFPFAVLGQVSQAKLVQTAR